MVDDIRFLPLRSRRLGSSAMKMMTHLFNSSLGKKYIMAVTGLFLFLFVVGHLIGNLQVFGGPELINRYGHFLQTNLELVWPARIGLLLLLALHVWSSIRLSLENKAARPVGYAEYRPVGSSYASRTMLLGGGIVFVFIVYHLLHFTVQLRYVNLTGQSFIDFEDPQKRHDIFRMMVVGFSHPLVSAFYILGIALLCLHLSHGASSMFQSLGWKNDTYRPVLDKLARAVAILIFIGYVSIPTAVMLGFGKKHLETQPPAPTPVSHHSALRPDPRVTPNRDSRHSGIPSISPSNTDSRA
jgi:succinate dehydrogenase / fumarate reductase cytochrome b subunit